MRGNASKSILKETLRSRLGNFVPCDTRFLLGENFSKTAKEIHFAVIKPPRLQPTAVAGEVNDFVKRCFYTQALVPRALNLTTACPDFLDREVDLLLNSGSSLAFRKADGEGAGTLFGCQLMVSWDRDDDYEIVEDCSLASWHTAAAEIAMEENAQLPQAIWREFQYQHLYNLAQMRIRESGADFCSYMGLGYIDPKMRGNKFYEELSPLLLEALVEHNGISLDFCTADYITENCLPHRGGPKRCTVLDSFPYRDQILAVDGRPVFEKLIKSGSLSVVSTKSVKELKEAKMSQL